MSIRIYYDEIKYRFPGWRKAVKLIEEVIRSENFISGDLYYVVTSDANLIKINLEFLNHDYNTDVIAFDYSYENILNGEIYISIDTVRLNSFNYKVSLKSEILRVMIHGVLHLAGYRDKTKKEKRLMRNLEDKWIGEYLKQRDGF